MKIKNSIIKFKRVVTKIILFLLCVALIVVSLIEFHINRNVNVNNHMQNVILLIGDGMGENHIKVAKQSQNKDMLSIESFPTQGKVTTFSKMLIKTDSAAAASAMATGKKTWKRMIAQNNSLSKYETLTEYAHSHNKKTGIISSTKLYDATPAAFSSHTSSRKNYDDIIKQQIDSSIDILIGEGKAKYDEFIEEIVNKRIYSNSLDTLPPNPSKGILCAYDEISATNSENNTLLSCVEYSLSILSNNDDGFFLMVEGGKIDIESHNNDVWAMIDEVNAFDEVVSYCLDFAKKDGNTCVIVTADHETGGLKLPEKNEISNNLFTTTHHTNRTVNYYLYPDDIACLPKVIDNTYIYRLIYEIIS